MEIETRRRFFGKITAMAGVHNQRTKTLRTADGSFCWLSCFWRQLLRQEYPAVMVRAERVVPAILTTESTTSPELVPMTATRRMTTFL